MWTDDLFAGKKPIIAMVHLDALPGCAPYNEAGGLALVCEHARQDFESLVAGGIDAVIFCNENDKPYAKTVGPQIVAAMTAVILSAVGKGSSIPFGVDLQWDPIASLAVAKATGASFIRGILCGSFCGDLGLLTPDAERIQRYRREIGAQDVKLLTNLTPEFSYPLDGRDICLRAKTALKSALVDGLCVSGAMAGSAAPFEQLTAIKQAVADSGVPVFANTGVTPETVAQTLAIADGCITATCLKFDRCANNRIDTQRVLGLMKNVNR